MILWRCSGVLRDKNVRDYAPAFANLVFYAIKDFVNDEWFTSRGVEMIRARLKVFLLKIFSYLTVESRMFIEIRIFTHIVKYRI